MIRHVAQPKKSVVPAERGQYRCKCGLKIDHPAHIPVDVYDQALEEDRIIERNGWEILKEDSNVSQMEGTH